MVGRRTCSGAWARANMMSECGDPVISL
jgi:hypothetical protein